MVGMGGLVSGTTHAPISAILIIFELTSEYHIIVPLMLTCVLSTLLSGWLHRDSIYTAKLTRKGVRLQQGRDINLLRGIPVREVMMPDPPRVHASTPFSETVARLLGESQPELLVTDWRGGLVGTVALSDIKGSLDDADMLSSLVVAADMADHKVPFVLPGDNLDLVMHLLGRTQRDEIPVCSDARSRKVVGAVTRQSVIDAYNRSIFQADLTGGFGSLVDAVRGGRTMDVLGGIQLAEVEVPASARGKTLAQADLRRRHDIEVVLIHTCDTGEDSLEGRPGKMPTPDTVLNPGDRLLVIGSAEAVQRLRE